MYVITIKQDELLLSIFLRKIIINNKEMNEFFITESLLFEKINILFYKRLEIQNKYFHKRHFLEETVPAQHTQVRLKQKL